MILRRLTVWVAVLATCNVSEGLAAQANRIQVDGVRFSGTSAEAVTVPYIMIVQAAATPCLGGA